MTRGWFDLFRDDGGPTLYAYSNRTSVIGDSTSITLYIVFATLFIAFFVVFPGIRKERFTTFLSVTLSLFVGVSILVGSCGSGWHTAEAEIISSYRAFSNEKIHGRMGVYIGLHSANVTLEAMHYNKSMDVNFNERLNFVRPTELKEEFKAALVKGLPYPILTVAEYMSVDAEGFCWGRNYRTAGYYTLITLWSSFALWLTMNIMLVTVPRYGAYTMSLTGIVMLSSNAIYVWLLPSRPLQIRIEDVVFHFELGWSFWLVLIAGALCMVVGLSISIIDLMYPHKFSTIMEMDYGTPFDRHTIIEDSHETKKKKKWAPKLEEPAGNGLGGLLRRLSKRDRDRSNYGMDGMHRNPQGTDNYAFEMEAPKSPWRYPHLMFRSESRKNKGVTFKPSNGLQSMNPGLQDFGPMNYLRRTDSKDSSCTSLSSASHMHDRALTASMSVPAVAFGNKFRRTDSTDSSTSSLASFSQMFGLSRNNSKKTGPNPYGPQGIGSSGHAPVTISHGHLQGNRYQVGISPLAQSHPPEKKRSVESVKSHTSKSSVVSRGYVVTSGSHIVNPASAVAAALNNHGLNQSGVDEISTAGSEMGSGSNSRKSSDETAIVVSGRKNSVTKAVRRNSAEHKKNEAAMW
jgi:dual oxidase maturation factor 1